MAQVKSLTQYVLDTCLIEDVDTNIDGSTRSSERIEKMLQDQIEQLREDFERERTQLVDQIDQKDKQIAQFDFVAFFTRALERATSSIIHLSKTY